MSQTFGKCWTILWASNTGTYIFLGQLCNLETWQKCSFYTELSTFPPSGEEATWSLQSSALKYVRPFEGWETPHGVSTDKEQCFFRLLSFRDHQKQVVERGPAQHEEPHKVRMGHCGSQDAASRDPQSEQPGCSKPDFHCPKEPFGYFFSHHNLLMIA